MAPSRSGSAILACLLALLAAIAPLAGSAGALPVAGADGDERDRGAATALGEVPTQANNSTVRHVDPESVEEREGRDSLERFLAGRMSEILVNCSAGVAGGRFDACNRSDGQYPEWLDEYAEVAGRSGAGGSNASANLSDSSTGRALAFERARENQTAFAAAVRDFRETEAAYERARERGRAARARELARRLDVLAASAEERSTKFARNYRLAAGESSANASAIAAIERTSTNLSQRASEIRSATFVNTSLRVTTRTRKVSFTDPLAVSGLLVADDGTVLANRPVEFAVGGRTINTTTDAYGGFTVEYRPTSIALDKEELDVRYVPDNASAYAGSTATILVEPSGAEPTITVEVRPSEAGYGDRITVSGSVTVDGTPVENVPVLVTADGEPVANRTGNSTTGSLAESRVETDEDGEFSLETRVPASLATGEREVRVTIPRRGRAIAGANASVPLTVQPTATDLAARATRPEDAEEPTVRVAGRLRTASGEPIGGREVLIRTGETTLGTTTTAPNGSYATTVTVPTRRLVRREGAPTASLTVSYDGQGTNLESAREELLVGFRGLSIGDRFSIALSTGVAGAADIVEDLVPRGARDLLLAPSWATVLLGAFVLLVGWLLRRGLGRRRRRRAASEEEGETIGTDTGGAASAADPEPDLGEFDPADWLLAGQPDRAVRAGYAVARSRLGSELGVSPAKTHREFYRACRDASIGETRLAALGALTGAYERATFAADSLPERAASEALDQWAVIAGEGNGYGDGEESDERGEADERGSDRGTSSSGPDSDARDRNGSAGTPSSEPDTGSTANDRRHE
jgi:phosphatidate phosphatase APP1